MKEYLRRKGYVYICLILTIAFSTLIFLISESTLLVFLVLLMSGSYWLLLVWQQGRQAKELTVIADLLRNFLDGQHLPSGLSQLELKETLSGKVSHELLRLEEQYSGYQAKINQDQKALQQLISDIAHQLRNPLVNIKTYGSLLNQSANLSAADQTYLKAIQLSEVQLTFLIESFIKISRFENNLIQLTVLSNEVKETILQTVFKLHSQALAKNITIEFEQTESIVSNYDKNWLAEALFNVLDNSIKYSSDNSSIKLTVCKDEMFTIISCRDFGMGIPVGAEQELFKRFYRGGNVTNQAGFGIGLYLAQEIMLKHHGFIKVTRENPGLTVALYF